MQRLDAVSERMRRRLGGGAHEAAHISVICDCGDEFLVHRFRSSHHIAAPSHANFGIKGALASIMILVRFLDLKFLCKGCGTTDWNFKSTALVRRDAEMMRCPTCRQSEVAPVADPAS